MIEAVVLSLVWLALPQAQGAADSDIARRLELYETEVSRGRAGIEGLMPIARAVIAQESQSPDTAAMIDACASDMRPADVDCSTRLWRVARGTRDDVAVRAAAASLLAEQKQEGAREYLQQLVERLPAAQLSRITTSLRPLAADVQVKILRPLLASDNPTQIATACRALGGIDSGESRATLAEYLASAPRGTEPWHACTVAAAELGDPIAQRTASAIVASLAEGDLIDAARTIQRTDPERAIDLLMLATRQSGPMGRLRAAEQLVETRPDVATRVVEAALSDRTPEVRAAALHVHRALSLDPTASVRAMMLDPAPLVRIRAAETILARAARLRRPPV